MLLGAVVRPAGSVGICLAPDSNGLLRLVEGPGLVLEGVGAPVWHTRRERSLNPLAQVQILRTARWGCGIDSKVRAAASRGLGCGCAQAVVANTLWVCALVVGRQYVGFSKRK